MDLLQTANINCPYCGEMIELLIDCSAGSREYVEDCQVCCQPMVLALTVDDAAGTGVEARKEND